jgi:hypothetical protein
MASFPVSWVSHFKALPLPELYPSGKPSSPTTCSQVPNSRSSSRASSTTHLRRWKNLVGCSHSVEQTRRCTKAPSTFKPSRPQGPTARFGYRLYQVRITFRHVMCSWQCGGMINACLAKLFRCHPEWHSGQYQQRKLGCHRH